MALDIMKMLGIDPNEFKSIGDQYEKRLQFLEEINSYQADLLEKICIKMGIDYEETNQEKDEVKLLEKGENHE